jgi:hypothetical protein
MVPNVSGTQYSVSPSEMAKGKEFEDGKMISKKLTLYQLLCSLVIVLPKKEPLYLILKDNGLDSGNQ